MALGTNAVDIMTVIDEASLKRLYAKLQMIPKKVANKMAGQAGRAAAKIVAEKARQLVPVQYGTLQNSIKVRAVARTKRYKGMVGAAGRTGGGDFRGETYYGGMIEFGTKHMPHQSFLRHAAILARPQAVTAWAAVIKRAMAATAREVRSK